MNEKETTKWFRKEAEKGNVVAEFNLGFRLAEGKGVKRDDVEAVEWLAKASSRNFAAAQFCLAVMHEQGRAGEKSSQEEALRLYRKSAEQGFPAAVKAMNRLAPEEPWDLSGAEKNITDTSVLGR